MTLAKARRDKDDAREILKTGRDPSAAKTETRQADDAWRDNTFNAVALLWFEKRKGAQTGQHSENMRGRLDAPQEDDFVRPEAKQMPELLR